MEKSCPWQKTAVGEAPAGWALFEEVFPNRALMDTHEGKCGRTGPLQKSCLLRTIKCCKMVKEMDFLPTEFIVTQGKSSYVQGWPLFKTGLLQCSQHSRCVLQQLKGEEKRKILFQCLILFQ